MNISNALIGATLTASLYYSVTNSSSDRLSAFACEVITAVGAVATLCLAGSKWIETEPPEVDFFKNLLIVRELRNLNNNALHMEDCFNALQQSEHAEPILSGLKILNNAGLLTQGSFDFLLSLPEKALPLALGLKNLADGDILTEETQALLHDHIRENRTLIIATNVPTHSWLRPNQWSLHQMNRRSS